MRPFQLVLCSILLFGCRKDDEPPIKEFEVEVVGIGIDCRLPLIEFKTGTKEVAAIAQSPEWGIYQAYDLDSQYCQQGQRLFVQVRKPKPEEWFACTMLGPTYPWVTIIAARAVP